MSKFIFSGTIYRQGPVKEAFAIYAFTPGELGNTWLRKKSINQRVLRLFGRLPQERDK